MAFETLKALLAPNSEERGVGIPQIDDGLSDRQPQITIVHENGDEYPIETDFDTVRLTPDHLQTIFHRENVDYIEVAPANKDDS